MDNDLNLTNTTSITTQSTTRRRLLKGAAGGLALGGLPHAFAESATSAEASDNILVVLELSGGNDGLNTLVPYADDAYYRARPTLGIRPERLLKIDDHFGFNPGAKGLHRLWQTGDLAVVHGCGYPDPSYSHFTSMGYWHTAAPHSGEAYGWMGRLADRLAPEAPPNYLLNVAANASLAVKAQRHVPVVFDDPNRFARDAFAHQREVLAHTTSRLPEINESSQTNATQRFLRGVGRSAASSSKQVQAAWAAYNSPVDYGIAPLDLPKVAACINHGLPTRLYYVSFRNNAFDTHVQQGALHQRLLSYAADAIHGFVRDIQRLGQGRRVTLMVFSEFGRRLAENANQGTDHGSANLMFVAGESVRGGHFGTPPDLLDLNAEDNLRHTTDFRSVYGSVIDGWLGAGTPGLSGQVLRGQFDALDFFANPAV